MRGKYPIQKLLTFLNIPKSNYYRWRQSEPSAEEIQLMKRIQEIYDFHKGRYGYRRITNELRTVDHLNINYKKVSRLMREMGLRAKIRRNRFRVFKQPEEQRCHDLIQRQFKASQPNKKWYTDVSVFKFGETPLYLSAVIDGFNNEVISFVMSEHPDLQLAYDTIEQCVQKQNLTDPVILHSDQGAIYTSPQFNVFLKQKKNIIQSMSHKGVCYDNVQIESFFSHLKVEAFYSQDFPATNSEIRKQIEEYIYYYNHIRIQKKLNYLSPVKYREMYS